MIPEYIKILCDETKYYGEHYQSELPVRSIYFGGGTPSLLTIKQMASIFNILNKFYRINDQAEISLEANPGTVTLDYLRNLKSVGFNRISFGVQSTQSKYLQLMGRIHDFYDSINAVFWAKQAGFKNINIDLIYGLPGQTLEEWHDDLRNCLSLNPQHFSLYSLGMEEGTPFFNWVEKGLISTPDPDLMADMYDFSTNLLSDHNFACYEISNFYLEKPEIDFRSTHNMQYWRNLPYLGLGAGAHGFTGNLRYMNYKSVPDYMKAVSGMEIHDNRLLSPAVQNMSKIDHKMAMQETMMLGLRMVEEGVDRNQFRERFAVDPMAYFSKEIQSLIRKQLIEITEKGNICLTRKARFVGNQAFIEFID